MRILLIRHGQTKENELGIIIGQRNGTLTRKGIEDTRKLKRTIDNYLIQNVYTSDLGRCIKTASILSDGLGLKVNLDARLREINFGDYQGKPYSVVKGDYLTNLNKNFPNGESNFQMIHRVIDAINDIFTNNSDKTVLIVTHSGPISAISAAINEDKFSNLITNKAKHNKVLELNVTGKLNYPK